MKKDTCEYIASEKLWRATREVSYNGRKIMCFTTGQNRAQVIAALMSEQELIEKLRKEMREGKL